MIDVCYVFTFIFEQFISYIYFNKKFESKKSKTFIFLAFTASFALQYLVSRFAISELNLLSFFICNFLILLFCYKASIRQAVFNVLLLEGFMITTEILAMSLMSAILDIHLLECTVNDSVMFFETAVTKIFYFAVAYVFSKISIKENKQNKAKDFSFILFILPLVSIATIISFVYLSLNTELNDVSYFLFSSISLVLLFSNVIIFLVHEKIVSVLTENAEYQMIKQRADINSEYYIELQQQYEKSSVLIHDIKKHLGIIRKYSENHENDKINSYIDSVYESNEIETLRQYSGNKLVNVIVSRYANMCIREKIKLNTDIRNIDFSFISESDLTALLDNLLENAYEAAKTAEQRYIDLEINTFNDNYFLCSVKNSFSRAPKIINGRFSTLKTNNKDHGIGIKSIERVAKKYKGETSFDYDNEEKCFFAKVMLSIPKEYIEKATLS